MMVHWTDGERATILRERKVQLDEQWRKSYIGDATYLRSLMCIGFGDADAYTELALLRQMRTEVKLLLNQWRIP